MRDIVELGMVTSVDIGEEGTVTVGVALTVAGCPLRTQIQSDVETHVGALPGVGAVSVTTGVMNADQRKKVMEKARLAARDPAPDTDIPDTARIIAIASGKGGVGKSSVTVNLAVALARRGLTVGVLDADIWGFSVPRLLGMQGEVEARDKKMVPLERAVGDGVLRVLSMGFLADEDSAIMWRGLILNRAVQQFLEDVHWGDLDYLLIDMPPGTGDIQMGLARMLPRTEVIVVTTPPVAAQKVAARTADMARKGYLRVAGVIENMSDFTCEHGTSYALFGSGGGARLAADVASRSSDRYPCTPRWPPAATPARRWPWMWVSRWPRCSTGSPMRSSPPSPRWCRWRGAACASSSGWRRRCGRAVEGAIGQAVPALGPHTDRTASASPRSTSGPEASRSAKASS